MSKQDIPYLHGFSEQEQDRLLRQAQMTEQAIYQDIDFADAVSVLEVGCGVGAQSAILLRRFPRIQLHGIDLSETQLEVARATLAQVPWAAGRYQLQQMDATAMSSAAHSFDSAFLCWVLEHVPQPAQVLAEVRRVLKPGASVFLTEVHNATLFLAPKMPAVREYWQALNDYQLQYGGDPYVGAKLGNLLLAQGYVDIHTEVKTFHFDQRHPDKRRDILIYWTELMMSAAEQLIAAAKVSIDLIESVKSEMTAAQNNPDAVFYYSFIQAHARTPQTQS